MDEIAAHSPSLKVMIYRGWNKDQFHRTMSSQPNKPIKSDKTGKRKKYVINEGPSNRSTPSVPDGIEDDDASDEVPQWSLDANEYDIWITTYTVLAHELPVARAPVVRPRREVATYSNAERMRSPLVTLEWYRVIMDEVQMVGGGKTEFVLVFLICTQTVHPNFTFSQPYREMVSLIPRLSSFAVSGTPARSKVDDLQHVLRHVGFPLAQRRVVLIESFCCLRFLRVDAVLETPGVWSRLQEPEFALEFAQLFNLIGIRCAESTTLLITATTTDPVFQRTVKAKVQDQLTIPEQRRFVVPIDLGRVERQVGALGRLIPPSSITYAICERYMLRHWNKH